MRVLIVGAGPAGLTLALLLLKKGIEVEIVEQESQAVDDTRAVFYQPVSLFEFERAGILPDVMESAFELSSVSFRDMNGRRLRQVPSAGQLALLPGELSRIVHASVKKQHPRDIISWNTRVVDAGQDGDTAWIEVVKDNGRQRIAADVVVGCDGGQSTVRRCIFGDCALKGFTWDKSVLTVDITHDFAGTLDMDDSNLFVDPEDAFLLFRPSPRRDHWRFISQTQPKKAGDEFTEEDVHLILSRFLPGQPSLQAYEVRQISSYRIHQRIVDSMCLGRIVLASDAAHLCCPYGALGLNGGIADVGSLYDCLAAMHDGLTDVSILNTYSEVRREKWKNMIDPQSQRMMKMVYSRPEDMMAQPASGSAPMKMPDPLALRYDFTKHLGHPVVQS